MVYVIKRIVKDKEYYYLAEGEKKNGKVIQKEPSAVANKKKDKQKEEFTTIRILKDLPSIVGVDGRVYGSFKIEDLVTLPIANADTFINRGVAEKVNLDR